MASACKIVGCQDGEEREHMCISHYLDWLATGLLPGPVKRRTAVVIETSTAEQHRAWRDAQRRERAQRRIIVAADTLADVAAALPREIRTRKLNMAIAEYTEARAKIEIPGVDMDE